MVAFAFDGAAVNNWADRAERVTNVLAARVSEEELQLR
jgi:hypothetical protein